MFFPMPVRCYYDDNGGRCSLDIGHSGNHCTHEKKVVSKPV